MTAARAVWFVVTVTDNGKEHGASHSVPLSSWPLSVTAAPLLTVMTAGEWPETRYLPGGRPTVKIPERPTRTRTGRCPAVVKVTTPRIGRGPGCRPPGRIGPPSRSSRPVTRPAAGGRPRAPSPGAGPGPPRVPQPASITATAAAQASGRLIGSPSIPRWTSLRRPRCCDGSRRHVTPRLRILHDPDSQHRRAPDRLDSAYLIAGANCARGRVQISEFWVSAGCGASLFISGAVGGADLHGAWIRCNRPVSVLTIR